MPFRSKYQQSSQDRSGTNEVVFWRFWERCTPVILDGEGIRGSSKVVGYQEQRKLLRTILFAETYWKKGARTWHTLEGHVDFVRKACEKVGSTPAGFGALTQLFSTVGHFLLPDSIKWLSDALERSGYDQILEDDEVRYEMELILRDCVLSMGTQVRSREVLRRSTLVLLDYLVNQGSSMAFQLRELVIAPTRAMPVMGIERHNVP